MEVDLWAGPGQNGRQRSGRHCRSPLILPSLSLFHNRIKDRRYNHLLQLE